MNVHFYGDQWSQLCHANDRSWREVLEVVSNYNQTQLQSTTAQFKNRTDGPAEVLLRPWRPGDPPPPHITSVLFLGFNQSSSPKWLFAAHAHFILCKKKKKKRYFCFDSLCAHIHYINAMKLKFYYIEALSVVTYGVTHRSSPLRPFCFNTQLSSSFQVKGYTY